MIRPSVLRAAAAAIIALGAGAAAALIQCSNDEGMDGDGWTLGLLFMFGAAVVATVLAHRWWLLWIGLVVSLPWISLVNCVVDDPTSDGMQYLYIPIEAVVTAALVVVGFIVDRMAAVAGRTGPAGSRRS